MLRRKIHVVRLDVYAATTTTRQYLEPLTVWNGDR